MIDVISSDQRQRKREAFFPSWDELGGGVRPHVRRDYTWTSAQQMSRPQVPSWRVLVGVWGGARTLLVPMNSVVYERKELFARAAGAVRTGQRERG